MTATLVQILQQDAPLPANKIPDWMKSEEPSPMAGGLTGGARNRIGLKGNRFRLIRGGEQIAITSELHLDVIIVTASQHVSRIFYKGKWTPETRVPPDCFSADGITPYEGVPNKQADRCSECQQNIKGSAITDDKRKSKACQYSKRIVVLLHNDPEKVLYQMDLKSLSIFGDGPAGSGLLTMSGYAKLLQNKKLRAEALVTRISFDDESSVPKVYFTPHQFLSKKEFDEVMELAESPEAKELATVDVSTLQPDEPTKVEPVKAQPVDTVATSLEELEDIPEPAVAAPKPDDKLTAKPATKAAAKPASTTSAEEDLMNDLDSLFPPE